MHSRFSPRAYQGDHHLRALHADGSTRWGPVDVNAALAVPADVALGEVAGGGPPTIANFDRDPHPRSPWPAPHAYEPDGTLRWAAPTDDRSSRKTGSSVFDFDGDGIAEAVYNDERWLRVYDGLDGDVRFCLCITSATLWEYPVIADVNNDGHAEIVVASNDSDPDVSRCVDTPALGACERARIASGETAGTHGIRVFASPSRDWVATRRIWNQHTYHVTHVTEGGAIPRRESPHWRRRSLNGFRQNVQPGAVNAPDLVPRDLAVALGECPSGVTLHFVVHNQGWAAAPAGAPATVLVEEGATWAVLGRTATTRALLPGEGEGRSMPYRLDARAPTESVRFRVVVGDAADGIAARSECRVDNNEADVEASCALLF